MLNKILLDDFEKIFLTKKIKWTKLKKKTFLISGANGFIATYIIYFLIFLNQKYFFKIKIILIARDKKKIINKFINKKTKNFFKIIEQDISKNILFKGKVDFILHLASNASPKLFNKYPIETILPNVIGTNNLLELSIKKKIKSFLFLALGKSMVIINKYLVKIQSITLITYLNVLHTQRVKKWEKSYVTLILNKKKFLQK